MIIDFHTHCFPPKIAEKAIDKLSGGGKVLVPFYDGTPNGLLKSMQRAGVDYSVVQNIATNARQTHNVNDFAISLVGSKLIPFGSVHPDCPDCISELKRLKDNGVKGVKFHPEYQDFYVDDKKMYRIYECVAKLELIMLFHCGFDIAYSEPFRCTPKQFKKVVNDFSGAKIVGAHLGGQRMWQEVFDNLLGLDVYLDTAMALQFLTDDERKTLLLGHSYKRILFATDAPWYDQKKAVEQTNRLLCEYPHKDNVLYKNAVELLGI